MKKIILPLLILFAIQPASAQRKLIPKFIRKMLFEQDSSKHSSFFVLPVLASAPETGIEAGGSALYSFYTDTLDNSTRVSNLFGYVTLTTKGQTRASVTTNYWSPQNRYHYTGLISYINFPFDFYGIGNNTNKADKDPLDYKRIRVKLTAEKRFGPNIYLGIVGGGARYIFGDKERGGIYQTLPQHQQPRGGVILSGGPSFVFDNRNNNTYTTKGAIVTASFEAIKGLYNINNYRGGFFELEYAHFFSLSKKLVLGLNVNEQSLVGDAAPFYLLPTLGTDEIMRGYYNGRFRDRNLIAAQAELRYRISDRFGLAGFAGAGEVFDKTFRFSELKPSLGGGIRYFFDVEKGLSMRIDYGIGEQRPSEKRQSGLYMSLAEAF